MFISSYLSSIICLNFYLISSKARIDSDFEIGASPVGLYYLTLDDAALSTA
jgi:hypothetical protein